jgi:hypothetical protein
MSVETTLNPRFSYPDAMATPWTTVRGTAGASGQLMARNLAYTRVR